MGIDIRKLREQTASDGSWERVDTYVVVEEGKEFIINCTFHPHHGSSMILEGEEGTLHIQSEDNTVVRQIVALGGGCALAIREETVEGLSPESLRALMNAEYGK
jgi:hypothetical protein